MGCPGPGGSGSESGGAAVTASPMASVKPVIHSVRCSAAYRTLLEPVIPCPASDVPPEPQSYRIVAVAHAICPDHTIPGVSPPTPKGAWLEGFAAVCTERVGVTRPFGRVNSRIRRCRLSQLTASGLFRCVSVLLAGVFFLTFQPVPESCQ